MKFIKFLIAIIIVVAIVLGIIKIKDKFSNTLSTENLTEEFNSVVQNIKWINTWEINKNLSWKLEEAKWLAEQYYNEKLKTYVDKAKEWVSWAVESAKWYYNQWVDDLWETITNKINSKVTEELDKIKVK